MYGMLLRIYYEGDPQRISICPVTLHALLHIAPSIRFAGPAWCYWAFGMERYCGYVGRHVRSRRHPWAEIDSFIKHDAQLRSVKIMYNMSEELLFSRGRKKKYDEATYKGCMFCPLPSLFVLTY